jgi:hypothetical protein
MRGSAAPRARLRFQDAEFSRGHVELQEPLDWSHPPLLAEPRLPPVIAMPDVGYLGGRTLTTMRSPGRTAPPATSSVRSGSLSDGPDIQPPITSRDVKGDSIPHRFAQTLIILMARCVVEARRDQMMAEIGKACRLRGCDGLAMPTWFRHLDRTFAALAGLTSGN